MMLMLGGKFATIGGSIALLDDAGSGPPPPDPDPGAALVLPGETGWVHTAEVGRALKLDFSGSMANGLTGITPSIPHTISGKQITITPSTAAATTTYTVQAGTETATFELKVAADPGALEALGTPPAWEVEVGRPIYWSLWRYHQKGSPPFRYAQMPGGSAAIITAGNGTQSAGLSLVYSETPGTYTATVRVTDRIGNYIDLSLSATVIATRSRTPTVTLQAGQSVAAAVAANGLGSGDVLLVPAALGAVTWGSVNVDIPLGDDPLIITGQNGAKIQGVMDCRDSSGLIVENFEVMDPGGTVDSSLWTVRLGERIWAYDLTLNGGQVAIPLPASLATWEFTDRGFGYPNHGINLSGGPYAVAHGCSVDRVLMGFDPSGLVMDCTIGRVRDNLLRLAQQPEGLIINVNAEMRTDSNMKQTQHPDIWQSFNEVAGQPKVREVWFRNCFLSSEGEIHQGANVDHDTWTSQARDRSELYHNIVIEESVFSSGVSQGAYFEWAENLYIKNSAFILHPDHISPDTFNSVIIGRPNRALLENCILGRVIGDAMNGPYGDFRHLVTQTNNLLLDVTGAPSKTVIFPNFNDTSLTTRQRFQLNQDAVAADIGPAMLRAEAPLPPVTLTGSSPADGATNISTTADLTLTGSRNFVVGTGSATLRNQTLGTDVATITAASVAISANQATIDLPTLAGGTAWTLSGPAGFLKDTAGNSLAAFSIDFTTAAAISYPLQGPVSSLTVRGVTINLSAPLPYFSSATGDPIFITTQASSITSFAPASAVDANGLRHSGAMKNPEEGRDGETQGFDAAIGTQPGGRYEHIDYNNALNIDPGAQGGAAIPIAKGSSVSIVKCVRDTAWAFPDGWKSVEKYVPFTFMAAAPASAGTWFRPGISTITKAYPARRLEDMDFASASSPLRHLAKPSGLRHPSLWLADVATGRLETMPIWYGSTHGRRVWPSREIGSPNGYSRDHAKTRGQMACSLFIGQTAGSAEQTARENLAKILIQWGIDLDAANQSGQKHSMGAGQHHGYIEFFYLAAFMMGDAAMLARAKTHRSNSTNQPYWVTEEIIGYPVRWDTVDAGSGARRSNETHFPDMIGKPDWSIQHTESWLPDRTNIIQVADIHIKNLSMSVASNYRDVWATNGVVENFPIMLLRNGPGGVTGVEALHSIGSGQIANAILPFQDRYQTLYPVKDNASLLWNIPAANDIYNLWRNEIRYGNGTVVPRWTGRPDIWAGHKTPNFQTSATSGAVDWRLSDWLENRTFNFSTLPVTSREGEASQDNVQFVKRVSFGTATSFTMTGLRPGTPHWFRWRINNSAGTGTWSQTWFERHPNQTTAANNFLEADRHKMNTGGSVPGGTFVNEVAPALYYMQCPQHQTPRFEPAPATLSSCKIYGPNAPANYTGKPAQLIAGIGYWQGGSATPSFSYNADYDVFTRSGWTVAYQWQRNGANISGATGQRYTLQAADSGQSVRCQVTVNGVAALSNAVTA